MSYKLVNAVFQINLPRAEKQVLQALASFAKADGTGAWPSIDTLVKYTGLSPRGVQQALRDLEAKNLIAAESSKVGGRHSQTVRYRILNPKLCADIIAAIESTWKRTGAVVAPDDGDGCSECTPTGAMVAPTGAVTAGTGAMAAPKAVREPEIEAVRFEAVKYGGGGEDGFATPAAAGSAAGKADKIIQAFYNVTGCTLPANEKQRDKIEAVFAGVPGDVAYWAMRVWVNDRTGKVDELIQPAKFLINELPPIIKTVREQLKQKYGKESFVRQYKEHPLW